MSSPEENPPRQRQLESAETQPATERPATPWELPKCQLQAEPDPPTKRQRGRAFWGILAGLVVVVGGGVCLAARPLLSHSTVTPATQVGSEVSLADAGGLEEPKVRERTLDGSAGAQEDAGTEAGAPPTVTRSLPPAVKRPTRRPPPVRRVVLEDFGGRE